MHFKMTQNVDKLVWDSNVLKLYIKIIAVDNQEANYCILLPWKQ